MNNQTLMGFQTPPKHVLAMKQNLRSHLEKQQSRESFFLSHIETLHSLPPIAKRKAIARSKRRSYLIEQLLELV